MSHKNIFISYSHDCSEHRNWTKNLADRLEEVSEISVSFDQYDLDFKTDKNLFMESSVFQADLVIIVVTGSYITKANRRQGGVGIETKLSSSRHWDETQSNGESNIIIILREGESTPNYLKEKLYIDFRDDNIFEENFIKLLEQIKGTAKSPRPAKKYSLNNPPLHCDITRIEDFLKINYKKRERLFKKKETTDFSNGKRIKFELWETRSPSINHYLFLFNNIVISKTIERVCNLIDENSIKIKNLTVLKTGGSERGYLEKLFNENGFDFDILELTYPEYIWDFCIDESAKSESGIFISPNFIDQSLVSNDASKKDFGPAFNYLKKKLSDKNQSTANVIIAPGGTGKTTLCSCIANYYQKEKDVLVVLLQSEEIKRSGTLPKKQKISSVYELYDIYASTCIDQDDEFIFDKVTFEVALLTGKLILIIDGLDELLSLFPDGFDIERFLSSIDELNRELASSKVIITSRNDVITDEISEKFKRISKYKLIGFDSIRCKKYLEKRFDKFSDSESMTKSAMSNIEPLIEKDENQRILPFVVDLLSSLVESSNTSESTCFQLSFEGKDYESNEELTDYLVYSIFRRESVRQDIEISISDVLEIFLDLSLNNNDGFAKKDAEEIINTYYSEASSDLASKILRNPLIFINGDSCYFKYDFIGEYLKSLSIINSLNKRYASSDVIQLVAKHAYGESNVFKDTVKYLKRKEKDEIIEITSKFVRKIREMKKEKDTFKTEENIFRAISFFSNLLFFTLEPTSKEDCTDIIKSVFNENGKITNLSIYGKGKPLDFSDCHITNSRFVGYEGFVSSKFHNSKFSNCYFDGIHNSKINKEIKPDMFDSCRLGDLEVLIDKVQAELSYSRELIEKELRKFFSGFFRRGRFKDQKKSYIKFSDRVKGIDNLFFDNLLQHGVIEVKTKKSDETYYIVSPSHQESVHSLIMNNIVDSKMARIISMAA